MRRVDSSLRASHQPVAAIVAISSACVELAGLAALRRKL